MVNCQGQAKLFSWKDADSSRLFVIFMGILGGFAGMVHGIFEALKGNTPTEGFLLSSIGAFTIIPNYLMTGLAAIIVALFLTVWTIGFIHKKNGPTIFLMLSILLFLVGGGVAQVLFFIMTWTVSTRINKPLNWWRKVLPENLRKLLAKSWLASFVVGSIIFATGMGIWLILTPPGAAYKDPVIQHICWMFLSIGFLFQILTIISGFARDIERQENMIFNKACQLS